MDDTRDDGKGSPKGRGPVATRQQVQLAWQAMGEDRQRKLFTWACMRARLLGAHDLERRALELLDQAVRLTFEGKRRWYYERCDLYRHLHQVIRSLADPRTKATKAEIPESDLGRRDQEQMRRVLEDMPGESEVPEHVAYARQMLLALRDFAARDPDVAAILEGRELGLEGVALQEHTGLTPTKYAAAYQRLRRWRRRHEGER